MPTRNHGAARIAGSFRDPGGTLVRLNGRIIRLVNREGAPDVERFLSAPSGRQLAESGRVVRTKILDEGETQELANDPDFADTLALTGSTLVLEHERIPFGSYPYEWPAEMLHAAAELTLELGLELIKDGLGLKDGTPYNVLFRGTEPVFVDVLSFERRDPDDPTWLPYAQFVRTFLLPLLANKHFGLPLDGLLTGRRDGIEPEEAHRWLSFGQKIRPPFLSLVSIPTWLAARHNPDDNSIYRRRTAGNPEKARFILESVLRGLRRTLNDLRPNANGTSAWSNYMAGNNNYRTEQFAAKEDFVRSALAEFRPKRVLDIGCNNGHFSAMAARDGASVVAIDYDPVVTGNVWRAARAERLDVLPLVVNITRPTPGIGWKNQECPSFLDRARAGFDCVLMLAVIHHILVTDRVPLREILDIAAELTTDLAVVEFVGPEDSMFRRLTRGREHLHAGLSPAVFEEACRHRFEVVRSKRIQGSGRWLYLLRRRP